jgi:hypothetical protein
MSDHYDKIIEDADAKLAVKEAELIDIRKFINQVCEFAGRPLRYSGEELVAAGAGSVDRPPKEIARNEFYGRPLASCVRDYLERRMRGGGIREATLDEIFAALELGNYDLKKHGDSRDAMRRGVAISLAKNAKAFHKLPNGDWGLTDWYNRDALRKERKVGKGGTDDGTDTTEVTDDVDPDPLDSSEDDSSNEDGASGEENTAKHEPESPFF